MWNKIMLVALLFLVSGCNTEKKEQEELFLQLMQVHDEVVPQMGKLKSLSKKLVLRADSLIADTTAIQDVETMRRIAEQLKDANEGMMEWMRNFKQLEEGTPHGEVINYLLEQQQQIQKVRDDMINSKSEAEKYLLEH